MDIENDVYLFKGLELNFSKNFLATCLKDLRPAEENIYDSIGEVSNECEALRALKEKFNITPLELSYIFYKSILERNDAFIDVITKEYSVLPSLFDNAILKVAIDHKNFKAIEFLIDQEFIKNNIDWLNKDKNDFYKALKLCLEEDQPALALKIVSRFFIDYITLKLEICPLALSKQNSEIINFINTTNAKRAVDITLSESVRKKDKDMFWKVVTLMDPSLYSIKISLAAEGNWKDIVMYMLLRSKPNEWELISSAASVIENENNELLDELFKYEQFNPSLSYNQLLLTAASNQNFYAIEKILEHPKFVDKTVDHHKELKHPYKRAAYECILKDRFDILEKLLVRFPNTDYSFNGNFLLNKALEKNKKEIVDILLDNQSVKESLISGEMFELLNERKMIDDEKERSV